MGDTKLATLGLHFSDAMERFSDAIERFADAMEGFSDAMEYFSDAMECGSDAMEHFAMEHFSDAMERGVTIPEATSLPLLLRLYFHSSRTLTDLLGKPLYVTKRDVL